ncbi:MAG: polyribonucleotide nucleotidyltransferase [bacterium]
MDKVQKFTTDFAGRPLTVEIGRFAKQAHGSCTVQYGETVVLVTAVQATEPREGTDFFPLTVDYEEKFYAAGKIKGSRFIKREGRASDDGILKARLIDRSIRPLFKDTERKETQVVATVLAFDKENDADICALLGASISLQISQIPWSGPLAAVRIGRVNNEWVVNPTFAARDKSDLDLVVTSTKEEAVMIEAGAKEVKEADMYDAICFGQKHIAKLIPFIEEIRQAVGKQKMESTARTPEEEETYQKIKAKVAAYLEGKLEQTFNHTSKEKYTAALEEIEKGLDEMLKTDNEVDKEGRAKGLKMMEEFIDLASRKLVLDKGVRVDGRALDEIRTLSAEVSLLPRVHGSALFQRGETQALTVVTLGAPGDEQILDTMEEDAKKRYMHHYNFPGFAVGEVKPMRGAGRREIGHGALAEKAIEVLLPPKEEFPYTIRVVSEILGSNGSSSQASVCGSSLALMDAGVPLKRAAAGIAMGLISDPKDKSRWKVITDIQGIEDHSGDMDFKVAGTKEGITAIQLDIKLGGIPLVACKEALEGAYKARLQILEVMDKALAAPRPDLSPYAPRIITMKINPDKIRDVIGPGGKMIKEIIDKTGVEIDIEQDGTVFITAPTSEGSDKAIEWIKNLTREVMAGEIFKGKVTRLMDFGAFVEILPKQEGLVHISELAWERVPTVESIVKVGDEIEVKVMEIDSMGRLNLSRKALLPKPEGYQEELTNRPQRNGRGGDRPRNNFNRRPY